MPSTDSKLKNLIFLVVSDNECYLKIVDQKPDGVEIDLSAGTWSCFGYFERVDTHNIGENQYMPRLSGMPLSEFMTGQRPNNFPTWHIR